MRSLPETTFWENALVHVFGESVTLQRILNPEYLCGKNDLRYKASFDGVVGMPAGDVGFGDGGGC